MKNTLDDLNNYLFEALERINDDDLDDEGLEKEIRRSEATTKIAGTIIQNASLKLDAMKHMDEYASIYGTSRKDPAMLGVNEK